jgi:hypothetical protein
MDRSQVNEQCTKIFRFFLVLFDYRTTRQASNPNPESVEGMQVSDH